MNQHTKKILKEFHWKTWNSDEFMWIMRDNLFEII